MKIYIAGDDGFSLFPKRIPPQIIQDPYSLNGYIGILIIDLRQSDDRNGNP